MHKCTLRPGCPGCLQEAAKLIRDWGSEGVQSAARIVGEDVAQGLLSEHVRQNVQELYPGIDVNGDESPEELQQKIREYERRKKRKSSKQ